MDSIKDAYVNEIVNLLGGTNRISLMLNGKNFAKGESEDGNPFLMFGHMKSEKNKANKLKIEYDMALDLYNVEFWRIWGSKATLIKRVEGVYADMVHDIFRDETGLALRM